MGSRLVRGGYGAEQVQSKGMGGSMLHGGSRGGRETWRQQRCAVHYRPGEPRNRYDSIGSQDATRCAHVASPHAHNSMHNSPHPTTIGQAKNEAVPLYDACRTCHEVQQRGPQRIQVAGGLCGAAELLGSLGHEAGGATDGYPFSPHGVMEPSTVINKVCCWPVSCWLVHGPLRVGSAQVASPALPVLTMYP